jgi:hypothetical protein
VISLYIMESARFDVLVLGDERDIIFNAMYAMRGDWHNGNLTASESIDFNGLFPKLQDILLPNLQDRLNQISRANLNKEEIDILRDLIEKYTPKSEKKWFLLSILDRISCEDILRLRNCYELDLTKKDQ